MKRDFDGADCGIVTCRVNGRRMKAVISAGIPNTTRKEVYRRDGFRCALCDSTDGIQIHHVIPRGEGGSDFPENLITLCWRCHALAHGHKVLEAVDMTRDDIEQACVEYVADHYAEEGWYPFK